MPEERTQLEPIVRASTATEVAHRLLEYVRSAKLGPGSKLPPERQLASELGVPRSALREALAALDLLGITISRQGSGNYLNDEPSELLPQTIEWGLMLGRQRTLDLAEARRHIEADVAGLAAERGTPEEIATLYKLLERMDAVRGDPDQLVEADVEFHMHIANMAKNSVLSDILRSVRSLLRVWIRRGLASQPDSATQTLQEHRAVCEAIAAGNGPAATHAMANHMTSAYQRLNLSLEHTSG